MAESPFPSSLIVDDSEGVCLTLSMMLEKSGFQTHTANTLEEGARAAQERAFDLVLVDRTLGRESGLSLAENLLRSNPRLRIVMMTGAADLSDEMQRHPEISQLPLLYKPFSRQELLSLLRSVLDRAA